MTILFLHGWQSVPGGVKPTYLESHGHTVINPKLPDEDFDEAVQIAQAEFDQHHPDVVVGSSRGGAVAMNIQSGDTPLVLLCPAWKRWGSVRTTKKNTVILHSRADDVIPFAESEELVKNSGLPSSALIEVGNDHRLADPESLKKMLMAGRSLLKPASFSSAFPHAYHVFPLHALKSIATSRRLLSKADLKAAGTPLRRSSTADVDYALGLSQFVHLYLPTNQELAFRDLPILLTQLKPSTVSPFPHVVMVVPTNGLADWQCGICNFNAAVSRPAYGTTGAGNHSRGSSPETILRHWQGFKADQPDPIRLRHSYWHDGIDIPLLLCHQITENPSRVGFRIRAPELLLRSPFTIPHDARFYVLSDGDLQSAHLFDHGLDIQVHRDEQFAWYANQDRVTPETRRAIDNYFASNDVLPSLEYDRLRPSL